MAANIITVLDDKSNLVRASSLLTKLVSKNQFSVALLVAGRPTAFANAHATGQAESFMNDSMHIFVSLGKLQAAFDFLAAIETKIPVGSSAY